jgi:hypothetical protein
MVNGALKMWVGQQRRVATPPTGQAAPCLIASDGAVAGRHVQAAAIRFPMGPRETHFTTYCLDSVGLKGLLTNS